MKNSLRRSLLASAACILFPACSMFMSPDSPGGGAVSGLWLDKPALAMDIGQIELLSLSLEPGYLQSSSSVSWVFDPEILRADCNSYGAVITALKPGKAVVTAKTGGYSASCSVTVTSNAVSRSVENPYVYSDAEYLDLALGETKRVSASLFGGTGSDISGFSFTADKPSVASVVSEGNYAWITGLSAGAAKVTVRHNKSAYNYNFLVSCAPDGIRIPYLTTDTNIVSINKNVNPECSFSVVLANYDAPFNDSDVKYSVVGPGGEELPSPPILLLASGRNVTVTGRDAGACQISVTHPAAPYPLNIFVRVTDQLDNIYIEPSSPILYVSGDSSQLLTVSLANLPPGVPADIRDFQWSFSPGYEGFIDTLIYGDGSQGAGDSLWISGKNTGTVRATVSHPLAAAARDIYIVIQNIRSQASLASAFISTSQNYIVMRTGDSPVEIAIYINNVSPGDQDGLRWAIVNAASDGSPDPVISWDSGTGTYSASARNALPAPGQIVSGYALVSPLKAGTATISISHPKSVYNTKIIVTVKENVPAVFASSFVISSDTPSLYIRNGSSSAVSVSISGDSYMAGDESGLVWNPSSAGLSVAANGASAVIGAEAAGFSPEYVTVSHPRASSPLHIPVVCYSSSSELASHKYLVPNNPYLALYEGQSADLSVAAFNLGASDSIEWHISGDSMVSLRQKDNTTAAVTALRHGSPAVTARIRGTDRAAVFYIVIKPLSLIDETPSSFSISTDTPSLRVRNGSSVAVSVSISGYSYTAGDENDLRWHPSSAGLSVAANGASAVIGAEAAGFSPEYVTVSHPRASSPLHIPVVCYSSSSELASHKYLVPNNPYLALYEGQSADLSVAAFNLGASDSIEWHISGDSMVSLRQKDNTTAAVTALRYGVPTVTARIRGTDQAAAFYIVIKPLSLIKEPPPSYLTTSQNVVLLAAGKGKKVTVSPVNIPEQYHHSILWANGSPSVLDVVPNGNSATFRALAETGKAVVTVTSPHSANSLEIYVHIGDEHEYKNPDYAYISTPRDTLALEAGTGDTMLQAVLAHTASAELGTSGFSFSINKPQVASITASLNSVFIKPVSPGVAILTVSNPLAVYPKEVLIIVEKEGGNSAPSPYITTSNNVITLLSGDTAPVSVTLAGYSGTGNTGWAWQSENQAVAGVLASSGATAMVRGYSPGTTYVTVGNDRASAPLKIIVVCIDKAAARDSPWIKTSSNIINLRANASSVLTAEMVGGQESDAASFLWSVSDGSVALVSGNGRSVSVRGLKEGMAYINIRNSLYPDAYAKSVLVVVDKEVSGDCYISVNNSIVTLKPDAANAAVIKASLVGGSFSDPQNFVWWADDYNLVRLAAVTDTAQVQPLGLSGVTYLHVKHPKAAGIVDILVTVSNVEKFAFSAHSKTVSPGQVYFIPMEIPAASGNTAVAYRSNNESVCAVTGSSSVAMIAGIASGQTTVTAELSNSSRVIATAELAVIVSYQSPDVNRLAAASTILNMKNGESRTVRVELQGTGIEPGDENSISWKSSQPSALSLLSSGSQDIKGRYAHVTARNTTKSSIEAVLTVTHPKCESELGIWVVIPGDAEVSLALDQTYIEMYKDDGSVSVSATLANAPQTEYENISWSASKSGGATIVSLTKSNGRTCNLVPRSPGRTTLRAQLPGGAYADCIVIVKQSAQLILASSSIHVNPGFSETVKFTSSPENAMINWVSQFNSSNPDAAFFEFSVDNAAKTVTVTGKEIGAGTVSGYFTGSAGGATAALKVYVEYTYDLALHTESSRIHYEPEGQTAKVRFSVFPHSITVDAQSSDTDKLQVKGVSLDPRTGEGEILLSPVGEMYGAVLTVTAKNMDDPAGIKVTRTQIFDIYYDTVGFDVDFNYTAGAFTRFEPEEGDHGTLYLGDGETKAFSVTPKEKNASVSGITAAWFGNGSDPHVLTNGGKTAVTKDGHGDSGLWRIAHSEDVVKHVYWAKYWIKVHYTQIHYFNGDPDSAPYPASGTLIDDLTFDLGERPVPRPFGLLIPPLLKIHFPVPYPAGREFSTSNMSSYPVINTYAFSYYELPNPRIVDPDEWDSDPNLYFDISTDRFFIYDKNLLEYKSSEDRSVKNSRTGFIRITFTRFNNQKFEYDIPVVVEIRDCPAYMKD